MSVVIGLNGYHGDAAAAIVVGQKLIAAAEEERFNRIKHWAGFPAQALAYCLDEAGVSLGDVDVIAVNSNPKAQLFAKLRYTLGRRPSPKLLAQRLKNARARHGLEVDLAQHFGTEVFRGTIARIEHHRCHLASSYLISPFDRAVALSVDGFGDFCSAAWGLAERGQFKIENRVLFPHSLGIFYQAVTQYLGFPNYGDEYKVMGLASYGEPTAVDALHQLVKLRSDGHFKLDLRYFRHAKEHVPYQWSDGSPSVGRLYTDALVDLLGPARTADEPLTQRHRDLARSAQAVYESALFHLLRALHAEYACDELVLSGGCAMNSVANGRIYDSTPFKRVFIQPAAGDAGGAVGAALLASKAPRVTPKTACYLGAAFDQVQCRAAIDRAQAALEDARCSVESLTEDELIGRAVDCLQGDTVIGWFQGRMEWGPRALGNRSILADPRRADARELLNLKIKRRESFRPFAPSILREAVADWFEVDDDVPYMLKVFPIKRSQRDRIPAVTHVDGTGRLQSVTAAQNPRYHRLIKAFGDATGVPILLNTSFNENEPIVHTPAQALDCFLRTNMDALALGDFWIERRRSA